jgi:DNA-binding transcriptional LysR family regulator
LRGKTRGFRNAFATRFGCLGLHNPFENAASGGAGKGIPMMVSRAGVPFGPVDHALADRGQARRVVATVVNFTALMLLVAQSDLVASVGERIAVQMSQLLGLSIHALPLEVSGFTMSMAWHQMTDADAGQRWFRDQLRAVCSGL